MHSKLRLFEAPIWILAAIITFILSSLVFEQSKFAALVGVSLGTLLLGMAIRLAMHNVRMFGAIVNQILSTRH